MHKTDNKINFIISIIVITLALFMQSEHSSKIRKNK